jgi:hypothetical protein
MMMAGVLAATGGTAWCQVKGEEGTPKLPDVPYRVHDASRPQPPKVESGGALTVKAPSDAKVLFDGSGLEAWTVNGKDAAWEVKDGVLIATPGGEIQSRESFGRMQLHLEWRIPADRKVNGQGGGNSGVFLMGLYEIQVLESHGNLTYPDGQAGALYGQKPPLVNASTPQGEWQSYDITFEPPVYEGSKVVKPAIATVIHNGVVVQHAEPFLGPTRFREVAEYPDQHPESGPIRLQYHGDPIEFRNIWIRPLGLRDGKSE